MKARIKSERRGRPTTVSQAERLPLAPVGQSHHEPSAARKLLPLLLGRGEGWGENSPNNSRMKPLNPQRKAPEDWRTPRRYR
ncbi:MAG: hypothetical protein L0Z50_07985, partial [Verrucomicrobiales bacterium]|nr:hypothetical protein [Verrucomicrobiales bacterium]